MSNLHRLDEARQELQRAIESGSRIGHAAELWKAWATLADVEAEAGNLVAAAEAKRQATACYVAYRRDGGENHAGPGRLVFETTERLRAGGPAAAGSFLQQLAPNPEAGWLGPFITALQAVVAGSRDRTLANSQDLTYTMAAEILFLIETLERTGT